MKVEQLPNFTLKDFFIAWMGDTISDPNKPENRTFWINELKKMANSHPIEDVLSVCGELQELVERLKLCGEDNKKVDDLISSAGAWWAIGDRSAEAYIVHYGEVLEILRSTLEKRRVS